jgi:protein-tyrosine phosphatase
LEPWDFDKIRRAGVTTIVSTDEDCHAESIRASGLKHVSKYMPTAYPTNPALVARFTDLVEDAVAAVVAEIQRGGAVLVHCYAGRDRTGLVLCGSLMVMEGASAQEALARVRTVRPSALSGPGVLDVLTELEIRLGAR